MTSIYICPICGEVDIKETGFFRARYTLNRKTLEYELEEVTDGYDVRTICPIDDVDMIEIEADKQTLKNLLKLGCLERLREVYRLIAQKRIKVLNTDLNTLLVDVLPKLEKALNDIKHYKETSYNYAFLHLLDEQEKRRKARKIITEIIRIIRNLRKHPNHLLK